MAFDTAQYGFLLFMKNERIRLQYSQMRLTGILSVFNKTKPAVSNYGKQDPIEDIGVDSFEFWCPDRRPNGHNIALKIAGGLRLFGAENIRNGLQRPTRQPNAWVASLTDPHPTITLTWEEKQSISRVELFFDVDYDHPLETVIMLNPETESPFCIRDYVLCNDIQERIYQQTANHQARNTIWFDHPLYTRSLTLHLTPPERDIPASLLEVRCY